MKIYGLTIISTAVDIIAKDLHGKEGYRESVTKLFRSEKEVIEYALESVEKFFNIDEEFSSCVDDETVLSDENGTTLEEFKADIKSGEDICIQYSSFHVEFDFFVQEVTA